MCAFGLPTSAKTDSAQREDYLIERPQYVLSYNAKLHRPNWVSWSLRQDDIGQSKRGSFEPDPLLPRSFGKVISHTYDGSGFDRGHMCPAQDRSGQAKRHGCHVFSDQYRAPIASTAISAGGNGWKAIAGT